MKKSLIVLVLVLAAAMFMMRQPPGWLVRHDNGEAYREYISQMEQAGIPPNGYW